MLEIGEFPVAIERLRCNDAKEISLDMMNISYDYHDVEAFSKALEHNSSLTSLKISRLRLDYQRATVLAKALKKNNVLTTLDIKIEIYFRDHGLAEYIQCIKAITEGLEENKSLLSFRITIFASNDMAKACAAMLEKNTSLTSFQFSYSTISDHPITEGLKAIAKALEKNSTLTTISIATREISDDSIKAFAAMLEKNTSLTSLDFSALFITSNAVLLAKALEKNNTLTSVKFGKALIDDESVTAFSEMLKNNTTLTSFKLGGLYNNKDELNQSMSTIMGALEENNSLTSINLSLAAFYNGTRINSSGAQAIAKMLKKNSVLTSIRFNTKEITTDTLAEIANALEKNTTLTSIDDQFTNLSPQIKSAINRNEKINKIINTILPSLKSILDLKVCPDRKKEFDKITQFYLNLNIEEALSEIKQLHPTAIQLDQIPETLLKIAAKHPWLIESESAFEFFETLSQEQKIADKNQNSLETIALNYYGEINRKGMGYSHVKFLRFMLKNWHNNNDEQIKHLLNQCLYRCINGQEMQTTNLAIDPVFMLKTLATHKNKILGLLQEIPGVDNMIAAIISDIKEPNTEKEGMLSAIAEKLDWTAHTKKLQSLLQAITNTGNLPIKLKIYKDAELKQAAELISKIEEYSKTLDKNASQIATNKVTALRKIIYTYQDHRKAKEPLTKTLDAVRDVINQNKAVIRQHRHWSAFNGFFSFFNLKLEKRVTSYKLVTDLEKHIEKIQANFTIHDEVKNTAKL